MDEKGTIEKLEAEKREMEKRCENLAKIIEITSKAGTAHKPDSVNIGKNSEMVEKELEALKRGIKSIKKNLKTISAPANTQKYDGVLASIEEKLKKLDKISELEERLKKIEEPDSMKKEQEDNIFGGFGMRKTKKHQKSIEQTQKVFAEFKDSVEERLTSLETRIEELNMKLTPGTIKNLKEFVSARDKILDNLIPQKVKEEVENILAAFSFEMENLTKTIKYLTKDIEKSNYDIKHFLRWSKKINSKIKNIENVLEELQRGVISEKHNSISAEH